MAPCGALLLPLSASARAAAPALPGWTLTDLLLGVGLLVLLAALLHQRRRAHRAVQAVLEEGRLAQQSLRELLDKAPAAIWRTDVHGRLVFANRQLCEALGRSEDELKALPRFFDAFEPSAGARMVGRDAQALAREEPVF
ncbi:MAG: PAS domain-containing protein, partial [Aquimonas sp.]